MDDYLTTYYWSVNCTDGSFWTNETYYFTTRGAGGLWWNTEWLYRKEIVINHSMVMGNLSSFPVLISIDGDVDLASEAQNDADDIVFTDYSADKLDHEIEYFDDTTGELVAWVKVPVLPDLENTSLYLYYGNPSSGNQEDIVGVWKTIDDDGVTEISKSETLTFGMNGFQTLGDGIDLNINFSSVNENRRGGKSQRKITPPDGYYSKRTRTLPTKSRSCHACLGVAR